jgi:thiol-disulfide isomerase/thioredoxin
MNQILYRILLFLLCFEILSVRLVAQINTRIPINDSSFHSEVHWVDFAHFDSLYLKKENSKTQVFNFWATWCKPCVMELPYFLALEEKWKDAPIEFYYVSLDFPNKLEKTLLPFMIKNKMSSKVIVLDQKDVNSWIHFIHANWSGALPATLIKTREETLFYEDSFHSVDELEKFISKHLK